jgi:hypothetical protein
MKLATLGAALSLLVTATAFAQTPPLSIAPGAPPAPPRASTSGHDAAETLTAGGGAADGMHLSGWFLAPTVGTTIFDDRVHYLPGLRGGFYVNKKLAIGVAAHAVVGSDTKVDNGDVRNLGTYGGLLFQYVWRSDQLIHGTAESTIGDGRWCAAGTGVGEACSQFMVLEPAANVEINVARHVRLATGIGYRLAVAGGGDGPSSRDISGLLVRSSLIFGSF